MNLGELLLLSGSAFVVYAASCAGIATVLGRSHRVPQLVQGALAPGAKTMSGWRRGVYLAIAAAFGLIGQGLLLVWLISGQPDLVGYAIVFAEFALAVILAVYIVRPA